MLGALTLVSMRKEQRESRETTPLGFARTDELIDDDLRAVAEIAELALPNRQAMRLRGGESYSNPMTASSDSTESVTVNVG